MDNKKISEQQERVGKQAYLFEQKHGVCSQAVLAAFQKEFNIIPDDVFKAGTGMAGGLGLTGETCGALLGAIMTIGVVCGRGYSDLENNNEVRRISFKMTKKLVETFKKKYGSIKCHDVHKAIMGRSFNLWDKEDYIEFEEAGGHDDKCPSVCRNTASWAFNLLTEKDFLQEE